MGATEDAARRGLIAGQKPANVAGRATTISLVGAGTMGAGFVRLFADAGYEVSVYDVRPAAAEAAAAQRESTVAAESLAEALAGADLCIEAIVEELEPKRALFGELVEVAPPACVLATNTSALSVAAIAEAVPARARERVVGTHFFNPPDIVPAVEVVRGPETSDEAVETALRLLRGAGKVAAVLNDSPGFVANRIQHAMIAEAWRCLEDGVATAEAIDAIVSGSFGFRLFAYGPFAVGDFNGLDVYASVLRSLESAYGERFSPPRALLERVEAGELGLKTGKGAFEYIPSEAEELLLRRDEIFARLAEIRRPLLEP
jgi:3-hydroxybutyryl-CoA dehydrogenase